MEDFLKFLSDKYLLLILITLFLICALVGYFVDIKKKKESPFKIASDNMKKMDVNINDIQVNNNVSLQDKVKENAGVNGQNNNIQM